MFPLIFILTYFNSISDFYAPWKRQKTAAFLTFSGGIECDIGLKGLTKIFYFCATFSLQLKCKGRNLKWISSDDVYG